MSIELNKYLESMEGSKLTKDIVLSLTQYSPNYCYNSNNGKIELRTKPLRNHIIISFDNKNNKDIVGDNSLLEKNLGDLTKKISSIIFDEKKVILITDSERSLLEIENKLDALKVSSIVEYENIKERIMNKTHVFNTKTNKESFNPRKFSENEGNKDHKKSIGSNNKFDLVDQGSSLRKLSDGANGNNKNAAYKGKKSYNKYDKEVVPLNKDYDLDTNVDKLKKTNYYSFKELSSMFWNMKKLNMFVFPKEWEKSGLEELINTEPRANIDHYKEGGSQYRDRANTEMYNFKSKRLLIF